MSIKRMPAGLITDEREMPGVQPLGNAVAPGQDQSSRWLLHRRLNASDGTHQLLVSGSWTMLVGVLAGLLTLFVFGGMGPQGAHSNAGWLSLMVAMMATPFAILLLLLGGAKWLRNYRLSKAPGSR